MRIAAIPWMILTAIGLGVTTTTGYLVIRGPFLGGATLPPQPLIFVLGAFLVGIVVLALGGSKLARVYTGYY